MENQVLKQAATWGRVFEISVQRGVLAYLLSCDFLLPDYPVLTPWKDAKVADMNKRLIQEMEITDPNAKEWAESGIRHLLVLGYSLGWSTIREWLERNKGNRYQIAAIWCPLTLPGTDISHSEERKKTVRNFELAFNLPTQIDLSLVNRGQPGRADFLLWLRPKSPSKRPDLILCLEFSYNAPPHLQDYRQEQAHREEIARYARYLECRGVFSRVCAEVQGESLTIDANLAKHLTAFSSQDKPLYKLCQAASYSEILVQILRNHQRLPQGCQTTAIAVTSNGLESLTASYKSQPPDSEPSVKLMKSLGEAYRNLIKLDEDNPDALNQEIRLVFKRLINSLPADFKKQAKLLTQQPPLGEDFQLQIRETVENFSRPMQLMSLEEAVEGIEVTPALEQFFGGNSQEKIKQCLENKYSHHQLTLRNIHAGAIIAGLESTKAGEMRVIALEGNPGIGKTTAVTQFLSQHQEGYCFFYVSPRVVINRDITAKLARNGQNNSGILTITSNYKLINAAPQWYEEKAQQTLKIKRDSAVVVDGYDNLKIPDSNILFLNPEQEQEIETNIVASRRYKRNLSEREDSMNTRYRPGVLKTIATAARNLLEVNPQIQRLAMTAAIQSYRNLNQGTTIDALKNLFKHSAQKELGKQEREKFAQKIPTIIAMVDEVAGDGAGALFCHGLMDWLQQEFFTPFEGGVSPFRVVLIISDASLSNEIVLDRYLNAGKRAPDKVLISPSSGNIPFRVTGTNLKVGQGKPRPTLHIMTNSFPALNLTIDYNINLTAIISDINQNGQTQTLRQAINKQKGNELLKNARLEIQKALLGGAEQIIYFAQDKVFLRELRNDLLEQLNPQLSADEIQVLDQSTQDEERLQLIQEPKRDKVRIFLMTSSGSRGVSFPKTDCIIASIPRFNIEASLMEVAQLIYRGRGQYTDKTTGEKVSENNLNRRLVMLINDFLPISLNNENEKDNLCRRWLRQSSDLLTLLVMLRSTIHTRIKGDSGLKKRRIAFVPVGMVGDEQILNLISDDLRKFLQEAQVFLYDSSSKELKNTVGRAKQLAESLFSRFDLKGTANQSDAISYTHYATLEALSKSVARLSGRLLFNPKQEDSQIPKNLCCLGPLWFEDWSDRRSQEQFNFQGWSDDQQQEMSNLLGLFREIYKNPDIPSKLKNPAKELHQVLIRDKETRTQEYATLQGTNTNHLVIALPLDYPHFWQKYFPQEERPIMIEDPVTWQFALGCCLSDRDLVMPVLADYQDFPWAAIASRSSLTQLEMLFDNHYFVASNELNLLNTLLLEEETI